MTKCSSLQIFLRNCNSLVWLHYLSLLCSEHIALCDFDILTPFLAASSRFFKCHYLKTTCSDFQIILVVVITHYEVCSSISRYFPPNLWMFIHSSSWLIFEIHMAFSKQACFGQVQEKHNFNSSPIAIVLCNQASSCLSWIYSPYHSCLLS